MKHSKTETIHTTIDESLTPGMAEADIALPFQARPLIVRGIADAVIEATQRAADAQTHAEPVNMPLPPQKPNTAHFTDVSRPIYVEPTRQERIRQYFEDAPIRRFDKLHGSNLYGELQAKRRREALFLKAAELGLFDSQSVYYRAQLKRLAKPAKV